MTSEIIFLRRCKAEKRFNRGKVTVSVDGSSPVVLKDDELHFPVTPGEHSVFASFRIGKTVMNSSEQIISAADGTQTVVRYSLKPGGTARLKTEQYTSEKRIHELIAVRESKYTDMVRRITNDNSPDRLFVIRIAASVAAAVAVVAAAVIAILL